MPGEMFRAGRVFHGGVGRRPVAVLMAGAWTASAFGIGMFLGHSAAPFRWDPNPAGRLAVPPRRDRARDAANGTRGLARTFQPHGGPMPHHGDVIGWLLDEGDRAD